MLKPVTGLLHQLGIGQHADHGQDSRNGQLSCNYNSGPPRKLGVTTNYQKSILTPSTTIEFLGFLVESNTLTLSLLVEKIKKAKKACLSTTFPTLTLPNIHYPGSLPNTNLVSALTNRQK